MPESISGEVLVPPTKREQILDETLLLMGDNGYRGMSFKDVAKRCNLTKQGVLHYFPTKQKLLFALLEERDAQIESVLLAILAQDGFEETANEAEARRIFRNSLVRVVEHMIGEPDLIRLHVVLRAEAIGPDHPARDYFTTRDSDTLLWLSKRLGAFDAAPVSAARRILAMMLGLEQQWLQEMRGFDLLAEWKQALFALIPDHDC